MLESAPLVVIASDDPQRLSTLLVRLKQIGTAAPIEVVAFGPQWSEVLDAAAALGAYGYSPPDPLTGDRWAALGWALTAGQFSRGGYDAVALLADDARPFPGWLDELAAALDPVAVDVEGTKAGPGMVSPVGIVCPVSDQVRSTAQRVTLTDADVAAGIEQYAAARREAFSGIVSVLDVPDDLCVLVRGDVLDDDRILRPGLGAWTLADLVLRAEVAGGWRAVVAEGCYVGRSRAVAHRPETPDDVAARVRFYDQHTAATREPVVIAAYRVRITRLRDLALLRESIGSVSGLVDGVAVLLCNNPLDAQADPESAATLRDGKAPGYDACLLRACSGADAERVAIEFGGWVTTAAQGHGKIRVAAEVWTGKPDVATELDALGDVVHRLGLVGRNLWCLALEQDELVEPRVTREWLHRLCAHPNPTVQAYDVSILTVWDAPTLVREDAPFGDGGSRRGGPSALRLFRADPRRPHPRFVSGGSALAPVCSADAVRVANLRLYRVGLSTPQDRAHARLADSEEGMRLSAVRFATRIGLHMLVYERENPEDVARWLDELHGLLDETALVWTGAWTDEDYAAPPEEPHATGPAPDLLEIGMLHGAAFVRHPLADDIAGARNAGLDALSREHDGLTWGLFFDPDEWLADPIVDCRALRRMAESSRRGWLVQAVNHTQDGPPSVSDSLRMSALVPAMRMNGRVHESFSDAIKAYQATGKHPRIGYAPFALQHRGMALGTERTADKLDAYERLLRLELADRPRDPGAWVSLGWHFANDGHPIEAEECLRRAVDCAGTSYLPFRELAIVRLREARALFDACVERLAPAHPYTKHAQQIAAWLHENAPDATEMPHHPREVAPLPAFEYDRSKGGS